jgi:hypothetical protein
MEILMADKKPFYYHNATMRPYGGKNDKKRLVIYKNGVLITRHGRSKIERP